MGQLVKSLEGQLSQRVNELTQHASNQFQALGSDMQHQKRSWWNNIDRR